MCRRLLQYTFSCLILKASIRLSVPEKKVPGRCRSESDEKWFSLNRSIPLFRFNYHARKKSVSSLIDLSRATTLDCRVWSISLNSSGFEMPKVVALILARKGQFYDLVSPPYTVFLFDRFSLWHKKSLQLLYPINASGEPTHHPSQLCCRCITCPWVLNQITWVDPRHPYPIWEYSFILGAKCNDWLCAS